LLAEADDLVCRRVIAISNVLEAQQQEQQQQHQSRRQMRRFEQALSLLKLLVRSDAVFLPRAGAALCDRLIPLLLANSFANVASTDVNVKTAAWLDLRDVLMVLTLLRKQLRRELKSNNNEDRAAPLRRLGEALARAERLLCHTHLGGLAEKPADGGKSRHLFGASPAEFRLAEQVVPVLAVWAAWSGDNGGGSNSSEERGEVLKATLRHVLTLVIQPMSLLNENLSNAARGHVMMNGEMGVVDRSKNHLAWLRTLRLTVLAVDQQLDACGQDPADIDDALSVLRAWSKRLVMNTSMFARLPRDKMLLQQTRRDDDVAAQQSLDQWYDKFWKKTVPVLVSTNQQQHQQQHQQHQGSSRPVSSSSETAAAEEKHSEVNVDRVMEGLL
jgi:hypothetical protein